MALVAEEQEPFVYGILRLPRGSPNHNAFSRLLRNRITPHRSDPWLAPLSNRRMQWQSMATDCAPPSIALRAGRSRTRSALWAVREARCGRRPGPTPSRSRTTFLYHQQIRTELGVGSRSLLCDQARPNSVDMYRMPALSTTTIVEPCVAMQPVSAIPLIHVGRPCSMAPLSPSGLVGRR